VYCQSARYGQIVKQHSSPRNPRTEPQQANRQAFGAVASQWRGLPPEYRIEWNIAAEKDRTGICGYNYFMKLNAARVHIGLGRVDRPPSAQPSHPVNPVGEVVITGTGADLSVKLPVSSAPAQYTLVEVAAPVSAGVRCVQAYRYVGLLPAAVDGYSDVTALVVKRFGKLTPGEVLFIRTRQQIDGWMDEPKVTSALVPVG
jgi:hypothetical protein